MTSKLNSELNSDEAVSQLRASLNESVERCRKWKMGFVASFLLSFAIMAVAAILYPHATIGNGVLVGVSALFMSLGMVAVIESNENDNSRMLRDLLPLSETTFCVEALALCEQSEKARQVRDLALAAGRQLYAFDYKEMIAQSCQDGNDKASAAQREACRALHQIA